MDCYAKVPADQFSGMNKDEQADVCKAEVHAVREFIKSGVPDFRNVLAERISSMEKPQNQE